MMHHPNMHHQQMSGHPPQHMGGHQGMPGHHQLPPHQLHRENRHVTLTRVPLGPSGAGGPLGAHGQALGGMGAMGVHHPSAQRPPHPIRAMSHHPQPQHLPMKQLRRPYGAGGGYGGGGPGGAMPPPYAPPPMSRAPHQPLLRPPLHNVVSTQPSTTTTTTLPTTASESVTTDTSNTASGGAATALAAAGAGAATVVSANIDGEDAATGDTEAACPSAASQANSKEKTPMCLVNELARYNKIKHQYRLTSETGPAHKKVFTVTLRLSDSEEYTAEGSSIKRAQHAAATAALAATSYPPPPQRSLPTHSAAHPHHRHSVMPTVELNALAMKLCQPAVYTSLPPVTRLLRPRAGPFRAHAMITAFPAPTLVYRVRVSVGDQVWLGEGSTPQAARHDAAARALHDLRAPPAQRDAAPPLPTDTDHAGEQNSDLLNAEVKSPVSLVHEIALKRNLTVHFTVKSERGPPHMRVFVTTCTVGDMETEGEGNGKKVSKRRAAERMLDEMRRRWPPAILRARPPGDKRRHQPAKKKPRNLIKENGTTGTGSCGADNPISRLAVARHAVRARSPQYRVLEERGVARRREFVVQCDAPPHSALGLGPNKKTAKRRAAHNVLLAMEMGASASNTLGTTGKATKTNANSGGDATNIDTKRKDGDMLSSNSGGGANSEVRQPVPGVLLMDYQKRTGQPHQPNGVSETSATGGAGGTAHGATVHGAKDKLMYLSELLGFTVQFSDFPKRNHGEYLSLVSLSTEPPVMCHGGGPSTAHSHEQCSRAALRSLSMMGLDAPSPGMASAPGAGSKAGAGVKTTAGSSALAD